jgi:hypothetical protein
MKLKSTKKQPKQYADQNPIEALRSIGGGVKNSFVEDLGKDSISDMWDQILNAPTKDNKPHSASGDLSHGEEISFEDIKHSSEAIEHSEEFHHYKNEVIHAEKRVASESSAELKVKIQEILIEIKKLSESSAELKSEFAEIAMEEVPETPGTYHLSFLEFVLDTIRNLRTKVEESGAWLNAFYSKKAKRGYWAQYKKHGTSFGLSNERAVATQTG